MKMKIAIIDPLGSHGGSFHLYTFGQAIGLNNSDIDVSIYTNNFTSNPNNTKIKTFFFYNDIFVKKSKILNGLKWIWGSLKSIFHARFSGIKVFHFHIFYSNILVLFNLLLVKLIFGKIVLTIHDVNSFSDKLDSPLITRLVYKFADLIFTHNEFSKIEILNIDNKLAHKIYVVPHGNYCPFIDANKNYKKSREFLDLPLDKNILLFFGMIKKVKGLDILLKSLQEVISEFPDTILLIAGKTWEDSFEDYQMLIEKYQLHKHVILHNKFISQQDVDYYYASSELVVLPYKKIYQSGVLMMALSYEKPVLVSDLPPLKEVITDNEDGFVFKSENSADLSEKIKNILSDRSNLDRVRKNGVQLVKSKYNWNEIGRKTKIIYQNL